MTVELKMYLIKGWLYNKKFIERVVSISISDNDHQRILNKHAKEMTEKWPSINKVTWENL